MKPRSTASSSLSSPEPDSSQPGEGVAPEAVDTDVAETGVGEMQGQVHRGEDGVVHRVESQGVLLDGVGTDSEPGDGHREVERQPLGIIGDHAYPSTILESVIAGLEKLLHVGEMLKQILGHDFGDALGGTTRHVVYRIVSNDGGISGVKVDADPSLMKVRAPEIDANHYLSSYFPKGRVHTI